MQNILLRVIKTCEQKARLDEIEKIYKMKIHLASIQDLEDKLLDAIDFISTSCRKYIDIVEPNKSNCITNLDCQRVALRLREMADIEEAVKTFYNPKAKKKCFKKLQKIYKKIEPLSMHTQDSWPDVFIWFIYGNKRVAFKRIPPKELVFSAIPEEKGRNCGVVQTIFFTPEKQPFQRFDSLIICKLEAQLWMGLEESMDSCLLSLPDGFEYSERLPSQIITRETHVSVF